MTQVPIIDLRAPQREIAQQIADACKARGFFLWWVTGLTRRWRFGWSD